jgi:hypothetical protein
VIPSLYVDIATGVTEGLGENRGLSGPSFAPVGLYPSPTMYSYVWLHNLLSNNT